MEKIKILLAAVMSIGGVGPAVATKILYRKRPVLILMYDSVIGAFLNRYNPVKRKRGESNEDSMIRNMKYFREQLVGVLPDIQKLINEPEMQSYWVSPMRALEVLI